MLVPLLEGLFVERSYQKKALFCGCFRRRNRRSGFPFFIGIRDPLYGVINVDLALMIAYLVSAAALVIFSSLDKNGKKVRVGTGSITGKCKECEKIYECHYSVAISKW